MICRTWSARSTREGAERYKAIARERVLSELERVEGFLGAVVLTRETDAAEDEIFFMTFWASLEAIRAFAGEDLTRAVVLPEAEAVLLHADDRVKHWTVALHRPIG